MSCGVPGGAKCAGTGTASATGVTVLSEPFFKPLVAGDQKASLASLSPCLHLFRHLEGALAWGPSLLFGASGKQRAPLAGVLLCRSGHQALKGAPWVGSYAVVPCVRWAILFIVQQPMLACGEGEAMAMAPPPPCDSALSPCFHGCWLSSTGISHHSLLHHTPSSVNSSPRSGISPQSLNSSSQTLHFQGTCVPVLGMHGRGKDYLILNPFRLAQISCFTLSQP